MPVWLTSVALYQGQGQREQLRPGAPVTTVEGLFALMPAHDLYEKITLELADALMQRLQLRAVCRHQKQKDVIALELGMAACPLGAARAGGAEVRIAQRAAGCP